MKKTENTFILNNNKKLLNLAIAFLISVFIIIWIREILIRGIFVDEAANLPSSIMIFSNPLNLKYAESSALKPTFYLMFYGLFGFIGNYFKMPGIVHYTYINFLPFKILLSERMGDMLVTFLSFIIIIKKYYSKIPLFLISLLFIYIFTIPIEANTTLISTSGLFLPVFLLFIVFLNDSSLELNKSGILTSILFGILMSIQFYSVFIIFTPLIYYFITRNGIKKLAKFYAIFIIISLSVFVLLNPAYIINPIGMLRSAFTETGTVLSTTSGVVGIPTYLMGKITYNVPLYLPLLNILFLTQLPIFILMIFGIIYYIKMFISRLKRSEKIIQNKVDSIVLLSFILLVYELIFASIFQYLRRNYVIFEIPILVLSAAGMDIFLSLFIKRKATQIKISRKNNIKAKIKLKNLLIAITIFLLISVTVVSSVNSQNNLPVYTNELAYGLHIGGAAYDGAWNSAQADALAGKFIHENKLQNFTIISMALTDMVLYYAPSNDYIQWWAPFNQTDIINFKGDYVVIDEWYSELYGNPINHYSDSFQILKEFKVNGGYAIVAKIK
jgi:hypothetical protein